MTRFDAERLASAHRPALRTTPVRAAPARSSTLGRDYLPKFRKVMPVEYRKALAEWNDAQAEQPRRSRRRVSEATLVHRHAHGSAQAVLRQPEQPPAGTNSCMGKVTGFLEIDRRDRKYLPASDRVRPWREFMIPLCEEATRDQAARCMNCGIPFCHNGCPVNNQIPDWNDLVYRGDWHGRSRNLHSTNNFPEFTGRICPAPCEAACTLNLTDAPVTIKTIECADRRPRLGRRLDQARAAGAPDRQDGRRRRLGPGRPRLRPAARPRRTRGACLREERQARRAAALRHPRLQDGEASTSSAASRRWRPKASSSTATSMSASISTAKELVDSYDAVVLAGGAEKPRDLPIPGRDLDGIHFAMDFLPQQNRRVARRAAPSNDADPRRRQARHRHRRRRHRLRLHRHVDPPGRALGDPARNHAAPAGEGEQAADLAGLAAEAAHLVEQEEGAERDFAVMTREFTGENGAASRSSSCVQRRRAR